MYTIKQLLIVLFLSVAMNKVFIIIILLFIIIIPKLSMKMCKKSCGIHPCSLGLLVTALGKTVKSYKARVSVPVILNKPAFKSIRIKIYFK